jgi:phosphoribosylamine-glycine ligase
LEARLENHGIVTPETYVFNDFEKAKKFIGGAGPTLVFKPSGELPPGTTYVAQAKNNKDLLRHLGKLQKLSKNAEPGSMK